MPINRCPSEIPAVIGGLQLVQEALPEHAAGKPIEIWFTDEARVRRQGTLTRIWARRGTRPRAPRDRRYAWTCLFGSVCPERVVGAGLVLPFANTEVMRLHLQEISRLTMSPTLAVTAKSEGLDSLSAPAGQNATEVP